MSVVLRFEAGGVMLLFAKFITNDKFFVLGLEKCSGVDTSMVKMAKSVIKMLLFQVIRTVTIA